MKSRTSSKVGLVGSSSVTGEMLEKPCVRSRGHIFNQIIMKLGQIFCLHEISEKQLKTRSLRQILEKPCVCSREQIFGLILMKLGQSF